MGEQDKPPCKKNIKYGNLSEQVTKFRSARRLLTKSSRERYGAKEKGSLLLRGIDPNAQTDRKRRAKRWTSSSKLMSS
jgi:hypothetical protein